MFEKLTPIEDADLTVYEDAFEYIFANDDIRNVAISGPYSSGKSSILRSFLKKKKKASINVSLAHFENNQTNISDEDKKNIETVAEGKILNQILQQIPTEKIPLTHFHVKKEMSKWNSFAKALLVALFFLGILYLLNYANFSTFLTERSTEPFYSWLGVINQNCLPILMFVLVIIIGVVGAYQIIRLQVNKNVLRKISVQGNEIEIFSDNEESYFDKYLNEIVYLFEKTEENIIVFEDIDRFNCIELFERLREINGLSNEKRGKGNIIRFFYLLRDDIFESKDRTKFFDYIIPIIPVVDNSNSYNKMKEYLERDGVFKSMDDRFLRGLSIYVDDLRLLKNIYNEFLIYYHKLGKIELDPTKMLAIIVYKNIFPKDYADLQLGKGFVNTIFGERGKLSADARKQVQSDIDKIEKEIEALEKEMLLDEKELDYLRDQFYRDSKWKQEVYPVRLQAIRDKESKAKKKLERRHEQLMTQIDSIDQAQIYQLITRSNIDELFNAEYENVLGEKDDFAGIKRSEYFSLLKYIIREGYLDESCRDYMTFFYDNSLSTNDKIFLRAVYDKKAKERTYRIENKKLVMQNLSVSDFSQEEILNYDIFEYIINTRVAKDFLIELIDFLKNNNLYSFVEEFFSLDRSRENMVIRINEIWPEFFGAIVDCHDIAQEFVDKFSVYSLICSSAEVLEEINETGVLVDYIGKQENYLQDSFDNEKLLNSMFGLGVKFEIINFEDASGILLQYIYEHNMYEINLHNIQGFLQKYYAVGLVDEKKIMTQVLSEREQPLAQYIQDNIEQVLIIIMDGVSNQFEDSQETLCYIANIDVDDEEVKYQFLGREDKIDDILCIESKQSRSEIITRKLLACSANNILKIFGYEKLCDELITFINNGECEIDYANSDIAPDIKKAFVMAVMKTNEIVVDRYEEILSQLAECIEVFDISGLDGEHITVMLNLKLIEVNQSNYSFMRQRYLAFITQFVCQDISAFLEFASASHFNDINVETVLGDAQVDNKNKLECIQYVTSPISIVNKNYSDEICCEILRRIPSVNDYPSLFKAYLQFSEIVQCEIYTKAIKKISEFIDRPNEISIGLFKQLISDDTITLSMRRRLLVAGMSRLSKEDTCNLLCKMKLDSLANILIDGKRPRVEVNSENKQILDAFVSNDYIEAYQPDEGGTNYKIIRKKEKH